MAAAREQGTLHRVFRELYAPGLSGTLAGERGALHVPVSPPRLLQGWRRRRGAAPKTARPLRSASRERPCGDQGRRDPDHDHGMKQLLAAAWTWIDDRLGIADLIGPSAKHLVPRDAGWWYVFGRATVLAFVAAVATGVAV